MNACFQWKAKMQRPFWRSASTMGCFSRCWTYDKPFSLFSKSSYFLYSKKTTFITRRYTETSPWPRKTVYFLQEAYVITLLTFRIFYVWQFLCYCWILNFCLGFFSCIKVDIQLKDFKKCGVNAKTEEHVFQLPWLIKVTCFIFILAPIRLIFNWIQTLAE